MKSNNASQIDALASLLKASAPQGGTNGTYENKEHALYSCCRAKQLVRPNLSLPAIQIAYWYKHGHKSTECTAVLMYPPTSA